MNAAANLITLMQRLPRILLNLFHAQTDPTRFRVDAEHLYFDRVTGINYLARVLHALRPTHLGDVHQSLNAAFELNERTVISNTRYTPMTRGQSEIVLRRWTPYLEATACTSDTRSRSLSI